MTTLPKFMGGALTLPGCARKTGLLKRDPGMKCWLKSTLEITPCTFPENNVVLPCQRLWDFLIQSIPTFATGKLVSQKLYGKRTFGDVIWPAALARSRSGAGQYDHGSKTHSNV